MMRFGDWLNERWWTRLTTDIFLITVVVTAVSLVLERFIPG